MNYMPYTLPFPGPLYPFSSCLCTVSPQCRHCSITEWEMYITAQGPRLRNDLYCVEWDVKRYYTIPCSTKYRRVRLQRSDKSTETSPGCRQPVATSRAGACAARQLARDGDVLPSCCSNNTSRSASRRQLMNGSPAYIRQNQAGHTFIVSYYEFRHRRH